MTSLYSIALSIFDQLSSIVSIVCADSFVTLTINTYASIILTIEGAIIQILVFKFLNQAISNEANANLCDP